MRDVLLMVSMVACEGLDPRPVCSWQIDVVDATTGEVALRTPDNISCRDAKTTPDGVLYEVLIDGGDPVTDFDLDTVCDDTNLYLALEVGGLLSPSYVPWSDDPNGTVVAEIPEHAVDGAWFAVTFLETQPGNGGMVSDDRWAAFFQLGVADSAVERSVCYELGQ